MDLLLWMGRVFARFVAGSVALLGAWMFYVNLAGIQGWHPWVLVWILASGGAGAVGGVLYLLSLDGPARFRTRRWRVGGWLAMLAAVLLPTNLTIMLVPLVLALIPSLLTMGRQMEGREDAITSA